MNQFFDTIGGLPLHPLTVHAASVLMVSGSKLPEAQVQYDEDEDDD